MKRKMGVQESTNRFIHWFTGEPEDWHSWVYNSTLYVKLAPNVLLIIWSNNRDPKIAEFEIFSLMNQMNSAWKCECSITMIPMEMFHVRRSIKEIN